MGWSDIGCYGSEIETPNLDRLGQERIEVHPVLQHGALLSNPCQLTDGNLSPPSGYRTYDERYRTARDTKEIWAVMYRTIAEVLSPAKYSTYLSGKWHVTPKDSAGFITA